MMKRFKFDKSSDKIICTDKGKKLEFNCNGFEFYKIKIDCEEFNKIFSNNEKRCDFAIVSSEYKNIALLVELKGNDIKHACEQILNTKEKLCKNFENIYSAIVYSSTPKIKTSFKEISKKVNFIQSRNLKLQYKNNSIQKM